MPTRIKPCHDLGPCIITLEGIREIAALMRKNFPTATYSAHDEIWEIYDESQDIFLNTISQRAKLDSFTTKGEARSGSATRKVEIVFSDKEAQITCVASPEDENWFEHFMIDLRKHILPPSFAQMMVHTYGKSGFYIGLPLIFTILVPVGPMAISTPYCRIIIRKKPPNPFIENIKANLVSNLIWVVIGIMLTFIVQWIVRAFSIDLTGWLGILAGWLGIG